MGNLTLPVRKLFCFNVGHGAAPSGLLLCQAVTTSQSKSSRWTLLLAPSPRDVDTIEVLPLTLATVDVDDPTKIARLHVEFQPPSRAIVSACKIRICC